MFESALVALSDDIVEPDMVSKGRKPKLWDATGGGRGVFGQRGVLLIILERVLLAGCDLLLGDCRRTRDDGITSFIQRLLKLKVLSKKNGQR